MKPIFGKIAALFTLATLILTMIVNQVSANTQIYTPPVENNPQTIGRIDGHVPPLNSTYSDYLFQFSIKVARGIFLLHEHPMGIGHERTAVGFLPPQGKKLSLVSSIEFFPTGPDSEDTFWEQSEARPSTLIDGKKALKRELKTDDGRTIVQFRITENYPKSWNENNIIRLRGNKEEMELWNHMFKTLEIFDSPKETHCGHNWCWNWSKEMEQNSLPLITNRSE